MARSLNRVQLIGNLTRDPELRYTPNGTAVCSFSIATNRSWTTDTGDKHEETEFHRIVSWNKLAELCSQFLVKGRKVYVEGRLATRKWQGQDGQPRNATEIVIDDMILLDSRPTGDRGDRTAPVSHQEPEVEETPDESSEDKTVSKASAKRGRPTRVVDEPVKESQKVEEAEVAPDDIPF